MSADLKTPFGIALAAHLLILAAIGTGLPKARHEAAYTPVELVDARQDSKQAQPVVQGRPVLKKEVKQPEPKLEIKPEVIEKSLQNINENTKQMRNPVPSEPVKAQEAAMPEKAVSHAPAAAVISGRTTQAQETAQTGPVENKAAADEKAAYFALVLQKINNAKLYPSWARQRGYEGTVGVRFNILPDGSVSEVTVSRPCKCDILNKAACESVGKAAPFKGRPVTLGDKPYAIEVSIDFRLQK